MTGGFAVQRLEPVFHYTKDTLPGRMSRQVLLLVLGRVLEHGIEFCWSPKLLIKEWQSAQPAHARP